MSKPLTIGACLALTLAFSGLAQAGGHGGILPSAQVAPSQQIIPSAQGYCETPKHCGFSLPKICLPKISLPKICLPKIPPKCYEYEWVLKKRRVGGGLLGMLGHGCGHASCDYGYAETVYPTGQYASPQVYGTGQAATYGSGQMGGASGQMMAPGMMEPAPMMEEGGMTDEVPEPPVVPSSYGRLGSSLFGLNR